MRADRHLVRLGGGELAEVRLALRDAGLPFDDLGEAPAFFRLEDAAGPLGWAALERHGGEALLRSVVIVNERRGAGAGTELVGRILRAAAGDGVRRLWLLTETASPFFAGLGFERAERSEAPEAIRQTSEFANVCPASAECMKLTLVQP